MKNLLILLLGLLLLNNKVKAQYRINKTRYDYKTYIYKVGDPYNPSVAGLTSFLVPGLGQMISGEGVRGVAFLGGYIGCWVFYGIGSGLSSLVYETGDPIAAGEGLMIFSLLGAIGVDIWSVVDAIRVAKVNDLAFRDKRTSIHISPFIDSNLHAGGVTFKMSF